jgi:NAD-dependent dihydropyrimidine dehydrogenase PreA subunit
MKYISSKITLEFMADSCTGCGRCVEVCPHGVFAMEGDRAVLKARDRCMECGACARNCDYGALKVNAGVGCASAIITGMIRGTEPSCDCGSSGTACCG